MNINKILSTRERVKILKEILFKDVEFGVNEIARRTNLSKSLVSQYFEILVKEKILKRKRRKFIVRDNISVKSLKIFFNLQRIDPALFRKYKHVKAVGIYGSCVKGTNTESSDIDLWIKLTKLDEKEMISLSTELRKKLGNVKILFFDDKKLKNLMKTDTLFYHSIYFGSIIVYGEEGEI